MSYNEYIRRKKNGLTRIISPTPVGTSGLQTQILRYKAAAPQRTAESAGTSLLHSSGSGVLATTGNAAVCCGPVQQTVVQAGCCGPVYTPYPRAGYAAKRPDPPAINYPPRDPSICPCNERH